MKGLLYVGGPLDGRYTPDLGDGTAYRSVILALKDGLNFQFMTHSSLVTSAQMIDALLDGYRKPAPPAPTSGKTLALLIGGPHHGKSEFVDSTANALIKSGKGCYHATPLRVSDGIGQIIVFAHDSMPDAYAIAQAVIDGGWAKLVNPAKVRMDDDPLCRVCGCSKSAHDIQVSHHGMPDDYGMVRTIAGQKIFHYFERGEG
jgi:hypothetical protein